MDFTKLKYDSTTGNGSFLYYLLNLQTQYDPNILGRNNVFRYWVNDDTPYDIVIIDSNNVKLSRQVMESTTDFSDSTILIKVENCEQLIAVGSCNFTNNTQQDVPSGVCNIKIEIQNDLYFQNDSIYKNGIPYENNTPKAFYYAAQNNVASKFKIYIYPKEGEVKLQGIQLTQDSFIRVYNQTSNVNFVFINNIYFKDCVFTKIANDNIQFLPIRVSYSNNLIFNSCKMSIHIRASEYGYCFDSTPDSSDGPIWKNCSLYIEYSDLDENNCPILNSSTVGGGYYSGNKENCSIIIRNLAIKIIRGPSDSNYPPYRKLMNNGSKNCSWDIECYYMEINNKETPVNVSWNNSQDIFVQRSSDECYPFVLNLSIENSFMSFKIKKLRYIDQDQEEGDIDETYTGDQTFPYDDKIFVRFGRNTLSYDQYYRMAPLTTGVNVFNTGDGHGIQFQAASHPNVKQLSESDCKNPTVLNKWGFFVNHDYTYTPLATEPEDWTNTYWLYYYYDESIQTYKNIPKGMAPIFVANQYYQKVDD